MTDSLCKAERRFAANDFILFRRGNATILHDEPENTETKLADVFFAAAKAAPGQWDAVEEALEASDVLSVLRANDWLKQDSLSICCLTSFPDCRRVGKDGRLRVGEARMATWGMAWNGWCFTQPAQPTQGAGEGCSLAQILIPDAPERYFLPEKQVEKLLYRSRTSARSSVTASMLPETGEKTSDYA